MAVRLGDMTVPICVFLSITAWSAEHATAGVKWESAVGYSADNVPSLHTVVGWVTVWVQLYGRPNGP